MSAIRTARSLHELRAIPQCLPSAKGTSGLQTFRVKLRHADLLLIDDIHFLSRGEMVKTKEELFSTFNQLAERQEGRRSSDVHPSDIKYLEDRFIQRFTGGLVVMLDRRMPRCAARWWSPRPGLRTSSCRPRFPTSSPTTSPTTSVSSRAVNKIVAFARSFGRGVDLHVARQASPT